MQQISTAPKADGWRLPSAAHEPGRAGALYIQRNPDKLRAIAERAHA